MFFPPPPGHDLRFLTSLDLSWYTAWHSLVQACNRRKLQTSNKSAIRSGEIPRNPTCFPLLPPQKKIKNGGGAASKQCCFKSHPYRVLFVFWTMRLLSQLEETRLTSLGGIFLHSDHCHHCWPLELFNKRIGTIPDTPSAPQRARVSTVATSSSDPSTQTSGR